ncbi:MAG TPA: trehalose-phosphatase [Kofleriaceae bacterium]|nr:trehalose-phosphatase [Kofleriaceae bacterium]
MEAPRDGASAAPRLEAAVFDLDGVVTLTAHVHRAAWKEMFDQFLAARPRAAGEDHRPFTEADYLAHVDGRPRSDGVRAFLASRGITLPEGAPDDPPGAETVQGLARRKDERFLALVERSGVEVDHGAVRFARDLRAAGVRVGLASSSRNAGLLLRRAGLASLFEARVDGVVSADLRLRGKPAPDIFAECARRLGVTDLARALVIEDASSGVAAARAGGFGLVIGVDRGGNWLRLREAGADWIVRGGDELTVAGAQALVAGRERARPNALVAWPEIAGELRGRSLVVFLDYDGTLVPIAPRPEQAVLDDATREVLRRLSRAWPTHIISGRGLEDVRGLVGIDSLWVAASHGFDIDPPPGVAGGLKPAAELEPEIHRAAGELRQVAAAIPGALVEDKRFSIAVHFRLVEPARVPELEHAVDQAIARGAGLKRTRGKMVLQIEPDIDWDKGRALRWLIHATGASGSCPIFIGDDFTDEPALAAVADDGVGVLVTELPRPTAARYSLQNPLEVRILLERLAAHRPEGH